MVGIQSTQREPGTGSTWKLHTEQPSWLVDLNPARPPEALLISAALSPCAQINIQWG